MMRDDDELDRGSLCLALQPTRLLLLRRLLLVPVLVVKVVVKDKCAWGVLVCMHGKEGRTSARENSTVGDDSEEAEERKPHSCLTHSTPHSSHTTTPLPHKPRRTTD